MFSELMSVSFALEGLARDFEPAHLSGPQAVRMVQQLGTIRRLTDALLAKAALRVEQTAAHTRGDDRDAASLAARALGTTPTEARALISTATDLESLPATDAAVRAGKLSGRQARLIAETLKHNPAAETTLLEAAAGGLTPLTDACIAARAAAESSAERARRQRRARSLRMWTDADGMTAGRFALTPEIGGQIKILIDGITGRIFRERRTLPDPEPHDAYAADALTELILGPVAATRTTPAEALPDASPAHRTFSPAGRRDRAGDQGSNTAHRPTDDTTDHAESPPAQAPADDPTPSSAAADPSDATDPSEASSLPAAKPGVSYTVHILIDHTTLLRGVRHGAETCEIAGVGPVDPEWVREILGAAFLTAIIKKGKDISTIAHLGRHIPAELRTALTVSGRECDIDGCHHRGYLEIDHCEVDYAKRGPTAWWNLTWLCSQHHKRKTAGATLGPPHQVTRKRRFLPDEAAA